MRQVSPVVARFGPRLATLVVEKITWGSLDSQESGRPQTLVKTNTRSAFLGSHRIPDMDFVLHLILMDHRKPAQDQGILTTFCDDRHLPSSSSKGDESTSSALELNNHTSAGFRFLRHVSKCTTCPEKSTHFRRSGVESNLLLQSLSRHSPFGSRPRPHLLKE